MVVDRLGSIGLLMLGLTTTTQQKAMIKLWDKYTVKPSKNFFQLLRHIR